MQEKNNKNKIDLLFVLKVFDQKQQKSEGDILCGQSSLTFLQELLMATLNSVSSSGVLHSPCGKPGQ